MENLNHPPALRRVDVYPTAAPRLPASQIRLMAASEKPTVAVAREEIDILMAIRHVAPSFNVDSRRAEMYGIWTICYRRYCNSLDIPWQWMSSVSQFMDFLDNRTDISETERNRALDGIMFYLSDVRQAAEKGSDSRKQKRYDRPKSTRSLFAQLLLRCDVQMTQAFRIRADDVDVSSSTLVVDDREGEEPTHRNVSLPPSLRSGMKAHLRRLRDRTDDTNPLLFGHRGALGDTAPDHEDAPDDPVTHSTRLATQVMKTIESS